VRLNGDGRERRQTAAEERGRERDDDLSHTENREYTQLFPPQQRDESYSAADSRSVKNVCMLYMRTAQRATLIF
jgi:hypothetical protein